MDACCTPAKPPPSFYLRGDPADIVSLLVTAPLFESLVSIGVFELLRRFHAPERVQIFVTALFISGLHAPKWWPHAVIVLPTFCIQTASYLYWRRTSWKTAFWVVALIHALDNILPALSAFAAYTSRHVPPSAVLTTLTITRSCYCRPSALKVSPTCLK